MVPDSSDVGRILPSLNEVNRAFWTGGADGVLLICRCSECDLWVHPPAQQCSSCGGKLSPQPVSGRGTVFTYTFNHHVYNPSVPPPYVIAVVELEEQSGLRIPTNLVEVELDLVHCGMPVSVRFELQGGIHVPLFAPA